MREYFKVWHSMLEATSMLTDAELGRLFRAMIKYSMTQEQPANLRREKMLFPMVADSIDQQINRYMKICERNRRNGTTGAQSPPVVPSRGQSGPVGTKIRQDKTIYNPIDCPPAPAPKGGGAEDDDNAPYGKWVD